MITHFCEVYDSATTVISAVIVFFFFFVPLYLLFSFTWFSAFLIIVFCVLNI